MAQYQTKAGDTVDYIAYKYYGNTKNKVVENIFNANPRLSAMTPILPEGVLIELPEQTNTQISTNTRIKLWD
ncbi:tail protein X [Acinetobacter bereziniae]|uniref:tail protein X n=1 Tax=Acinetobacter bereziniae TaxID=106648 RepID=UPI000C2B8612|nr:tail protein X [Acinetobacter bereziniae]